MRQKLLSAYLARLKFLCAGIPGLHKFNRRAQASSDHIPRLGWWGQCTICCVACCLLLVFIDQGMREARFASSILDCVRQVQAFQITSGWRANLLAAQGYIGALHNGSDASMHNLLALRTSSCCTECCLSHDMTCEPYTHCMRRALNC